MPRSSLAFDGPFPRRAVRGTGRGGWQSPVPLSLLAASLILLGGLAVPGGARGQQSGDCNCVRWQPTDVLTPQTTYESRDVCQVRYRPEVRFRPMTTYRQVPEVQWLPRRQVVMTPQQRVSYRPIETVQYQWRTAYRTVTVNRPQVVYQTGVRSVCRLTPVTVNHTVMKPVGYWENRPYHQTCRAADCSLQQCSGVCRTYRQTCVPSTVQQVQWQPRTYQETFRYPVVVNRPQQVVQPMGQWVAVRQQAMHPLTYTVHVPQERIQHVPVTTARLISETRQVPYTVNSPTYESQRVSVPVQSYRVHRVWRPVPLGGSCPIVSIPANWPPSPGTGPPAGGGQSLGGTTVAPGASSWGTAVAPQSPQETSVLLPSSAGNFAPAGHPLPNPGLQPAAPQAASPQPASGGVQLLGIIAG